MCLSTLLMAKAWRRIYWLGGLAAFGMLVAAPAQSSRAGTFTVDSLTGDSDSGISTAKSYTHAADIVNTWVSAPWNEAASLTINDVRFEVGNATGTNWSLSAPNIFTNDSGIGGVTGQVGELLRYFRYGPTNNNATLTLTGLVPGESYTTTWYNKNWGGEVSGRTADISASDDGTTFTYSQSNSGNPSMLRYAFVAPAGGSITYTFANGPASIHQYGFSNELTSTPNQWNVAGGGSWNASENWSDTTVPNGADAAAWFLQQTGSTAAISLNSPVTAGSLYLDNTSGYNITGPSGLTMQVASGRALVAGMDGSHTLSAPLVLASDTDFAAPNGRAIAISGAISGSGQLFTTGLGSVLASGNSTSYSQQVNVQSGALRLGNANGVGSGDIVISSGAVMQLWWNTGSSTLANNITLNGLGFPNGKDAIYADGGGAGFGTFTLAGTITLAATSNIGGNTANHINVTGQVTGPGGLTKGGSRTDENNALILSNPANDYAGDTTVNKGTLKLGASNVIPDGPGTGNVVVNTGAVFDLGGFDETVNGLSGNGTVTNNRATVGTNTVTVHNAAAASVTPLLQDGSNGKLALAKTGSGTLDLTRTNTHSGGTTVSAGTLKSAVPNAAGSGPVTIAAGAVWDIGTDSHTVAGLSGAGTIRSGVATGADGAALIAGTNDYVHKLDFGNNTGATVNGVAFDSVATSSGTGWSLDGAVSLYVESGTPTGYDQLISDFRYNGNPGVLTFSDLTPGQNYQAVLYTRVGTWGGRPQDATFTVGTDSQQLLGTDPGTVGYYAYTFTAADTTASITMSPLDTGNTFHWFGASLERSSDPTPTLTIGDSNTHTFTGVLGGLTGLVKQGSGTQILLGNNTYTGGTTVSQGALTMGNAGALSTGDVSVASGANVLLSWNSGSTTVANNFTLNGLGGVDGKDALYADGGGNGAGEYTLAGTITLAATSNIGGHTINHLNITGQVTGPGGLVKGGSRTDESNALTLSNPANDYAGDTTVNKGTLKLGASNVIPDGPGSGNVVVNTGAVFDLGGFDETVNGLLGAGTVTNNRATVGTNTVTVHNNAAASVTPLLQDGSNGKLALAKTGNGTLDLTGTNTHSGGTTVSQGAVMMRSAGALGTGDVSVASGANVLLWWNSGSTTVANNFTLNGLGSVHGKDALYADGGGAGASEYTLAGTITLAATSNIGGHNINHLNITGQVTGPGGLVKGGSRTDESNALTLSNPANDYAGATTINKGTLRLGASEVIPHGTGTGGVTVSAETTLDLGGNSETINSLSGAGNVTFAGPLSGPSYFTTDAGTGISTAKTYTHLLDFNAGSSVATVNGVAFTAAGTSGSNWSLNATSTAANAATGMTDGGGMHTLLEDFQYNGNPAQLELTGLTPGVMYEARFYNRAWGVGGNRTQTITFDEDGAGPASTVRVFNQDASGTPNYIGYYFTAVSDGAGGALPLSVTFVPELAGNTYHFYGLSNEVATLPSLTVGDDSSTTFSGTIGGAGMLVKQGSGTLTLSGNNTYVGPTLVNAGTLLVNGTHNNGGMYTVGSGATLGGTGTVDAMVQLSGRMSPGNSVGTFTTGNETWLDGGSFLFEVEDATDAGGAGSGWDLLAVNGQLDLQQLSPEGFTIHLAPLPAGGPANFSSVYPSSYEWDFVHTSGGVVGFDPSLFELDYSAFAGLIDDGYGPGVFAIDVRNDAHDLVLTFTAAVPEPSTFALFVLGLFSLTLAGRRRRKR